MLRVFFVCVALVSAQSGGREQALLEIQGALGSGDLGRAGSLIDGAMKRYPGDGGVVNLRGVWHGQRGEAEEARKDFEEAARLSPGLTPAWQNLARACEQEAGASQCARTAWGRVLRLKPGDGEARWSLALLDEKAGRFGASLKELDGVGVAARMVRCADLAGLGRVEEAQETAKRLVAEGEFSEADFAGVENGFAGSKAADVVVTLLEGLDRRGAAGTVALRRLAIAYEELKRPVEARRALERVAVMDPKNTAHLLELARLADKGGDHEGALGYLGHARDLEPKNARIHFLFAEVAMEMNLPVQARASLEQAMALDPADAAYDYAMGFVILSTRDAGTAASYFQKFVAAKPESIKGHYALGVAYFAGGDYGRAKAEMLRVERQPEVAGGAEYFLGCMARREDDLAGAVGHLTKSIGLLPGFAESHTELARVYMIRGDLEGARRELERAIALDAKSFEANVQLLAVYKRTGDERAGAQAELVKTLDAERSKRAELMLRMIEVRP